MPREKELEISLLLDYYGELLTDSKREATELYYNEDLSLAEIADIVGISRQGVRDSLEKAKSQLHFYEEKLGLARKLRELDKKLDTVCEQLEKLSEGSDEALSTRLLTIRDELKSISI